MNIQDKVVKAIIVIQEAGQGLTREQLQAILLGNATEELQAMELDQLESFGIAEGADEEDWNSIIDRAIEEGLLKIKSLSSPFRVEISHDKTNKTHRRICVSKIIRRWR